MSECLCSESVVLAVMMVDIVAYTLTLRTWLVFIRLRDHSTSNTARFVTSLRLHDLSFRVCVFDYATPGRLMVESRPSVLSWVVWQWPIPHVDDETRYSAQAFEAGSSGRYFGLCLAALLGSTTGGLASFYKAVRRSQLMPRAPTLLFRRANRLRNCGHESGIDNLIPTGFQYTVRLCDLGK